MIVCHYDGLITYKQTFKQTLKQSIELDMVLVFPLEQNIGAVRNAIFGTTIDIKHY